MTDAMPATAILAGQRVTLTACPACFRGRAGRRNCRECKGKGYHVAVKARDRWQARVEALEALAEKCSLDKGSGA